MKKGKKKKKTSISFKVFWNQVTKPQQPKSKRNYKINSRGPCEDRTHDLGVISTTLCRLS